MRIALVLLCVSLPAAADDVYVHGHTTRNGAYVEPYYRTAPNDSRLDNYSTYGNVNPYTGREGSVNATQQPYSAPRQPAYPTYQPSAPDSATAPERFPTDPFRSRQIR